MHRLTPSGFESPAQYHYLKGIDMPRMLFAVSAAEFLDELIWDQPWEHECWYEYNPTSAHSHEVWALF